jgi:hypothetical protein
MATSITPSLTLIFQTSMAEYYVFQGLTTSWCQWYRPVVWRFAFVSLLKNRCYMSRFPVIWYFAPF